MGNTEPTRCSKQIKNNNNMNSDNFKAWILYNQSQKNLQRRGEFDSIFG